jgi:hypothetical protein
MRGAARGTCEAAAWGAVAGKSAVRRDDTDGWLRKSSDATRNLHLADISQTVADDCHALLLVDQAGWHTSDRLRVPDNISIVLMPPKSPELNPTENT